MQLASHFASGSPVLRSRVPLSDDQIRTVAPSIFADAAHDSRSQRYSYIPTSAVLDELRGEGFQPFMVRQTRVRHDDRREFTKHMLRLRHASQIDGGEANEIILLNSHDGTSSYQMLAGMFPLLLAKHRAQLCPAPNDAPPPPCLAVVHPRGTDHPGRQRLHHDGSGRPIAIDGSTLLVPH